MKYLTTLEVAHELKVSKQTLLNWLYAGKVPEPPRNRKGYRLWSPSRVSLVKKMIVEDRLSASQVKARRERRRDTASHMRAVLDAALDAVVSTDATGRVTFWNPRAEQIFKWSREEAVGRPLAELIIPPHLRAAYAAGLS